MKKNKKIALIIGAGPAGLTAAYELLTKTDIIPIIYEETNDIGGISKTINYKGNRIDIGGHRFFSKSEIINLWWKNILPRQSAPAYDELILKTTPIKLDPDGADPEKKDNVFLVRQRVSRIFYLRKFFDYPISLSLQTILNLGILKTIATGMSYLKAKIFPIKSEKSLEDFLINRFGKVLYKTFFKNYTQKVWGLPCNEISSEWGAQRIKGLSITKALLHAFSFIKKKNVETSLIEEFMYPKFGPGQLWEVVAEKIISMGGEIHFNQKIIGFKNATSQVSKIIINQTKTNKKEEIAGDYIFSTMPIRDLVASMQNIPNHISSIASGLQYRDFMTVGLLLKKLCIKNQTKIKTINNIIPDNWIYLQEEDITAGRLQIFNNWSPYMVKDPNTVWIGLEYFCNEGDRLWRLSDQELIDLSIKEMVEINLLNKNDILDFVRIKMPKAYPAYFGTYSQFDLLRNHLNKFTNLFLIGRNGMHRYNNADHSMLTAITAVENIKNNILDKQNIWEINTEKNYHERK